MRWSCGAEGRVPRLAQRRVTLFAGRTIRWIVRVHRLTLAYAGLVGPPELDLGAVRELGLDGRQLGGEVFLKAATSNSF